MWVLPESGASTNRAIVVHVRKREQVRDVPSEIERRTRTMKTGYGYAVNVDRSRPWEVRAAHRQAFNDGAGLTRKDWHAALGFNPAERVQCFEANDAPTLLDLTA